MQTDLMKRLRAKGFTYDDLEAADEIGKLRAALNNIINLAVDIKQCRQIARDALKITSTGDLR